MGAIERDNGWAEVDTDSTDPAVKSALDLAVKHGLVLPPTSARLPGADPGAEKEQLQRLLRAGGGGALPQLSAFPGQYTGQWYTEACCNIVVANSPRAPFDIQQI